MAPEYLPLLWQVLWALSAIARSKVQTRKEYALEIIAGARKKAVGDAAKTAFAKFSGLVDQLIGLSNHTPQTKAKCVSPRLIYILRILVLTALGTFARGVTQFKVCCKLARAQIFSEGGTSGSAIRIAYQT